jgi:ATP-dependent DNA helicase RecQ
VPVIGLTATAPKVQEDILKNLEMSDATTFTSFNRPNLYYEVRTKQKM